MAVYVRLCILYSFILLAFSLVVGASQNICWAVDGQVWQDNKKCPGSFACCGKDAICMQNGLCKNRGQDENEFVRGPCAIAPYDAEKCASVCIYAEGNRFPRVKICDDGSFCCDNDLACCDAGRGTFLDADGNIISEPAETILSDAFETVTSSAIKSPSDSPRTTPSPAAPSKPWDTPTAGQSHTGDSDNHVSIKIGLGVGIGVGIPAAALVAGLFVLYLRKKRESKDHRPHDVWKDPSGGPVPYHHQLNIYPRQPELHQQQFQMHPRYVESDGRFELETIPVLQELQG